MLYYADADKIIFGGSFGLFVHDRTSGTITASLDLSYIGCDKTQGNAYCEIAASTDGTKVYLHPENRKTLYTLDLAAGTLEESRFEKAGIWKDKSLKLARINAPYEASYRAGKQTRSVHLRESSQYQIGGLSYADYNPENADGKSIHYYPLFPPEGYENTP